ncbi:M15 family metallopeptidase [Paenibacillus sp. 1P03SA]|uniref:M15 family metallopeptidase n=1 Tax=Paenibacillus sp. 1P03SA TaxID=3132294 RepID=UPI0039A3E28D
MTAKGRLFRAAFAILAAVVSAVMLFQLVMTKTDEKNLEKLGLDSARLLTGLDPGVVRKMDELLAKTAAIGIKIVITDDFRSMEEQDKLYSQGRTSEGKIVTHAKGGESYHNYGLAIDFALKTKSGKIIWDMNADTNGDGRKDWTQVVAIAKELGFEWGGDWTSFPDYPHLQLSYGLSIAELQRGTKTARSGP